MSKKPSLFQSFLKQLVFFTLFLIALLFGLHYFMKFYTNHGQSIEVPDLRETNLQDVKKLLKKKKLKVAIEDSTYSAKLAPGSVVDQNPRPNSKVKKNRTIYLVINSSTPPPVKMPNLIDNSFRQAELKIQNLGLNVGRKIYKPDVARDVVLAQQYKGKAIRPNETILKGESIDLVLGDGFGNRIMAIPHLVGLSVVEAKITLGDSGLNVGKIIQNGTIGDLNSAIVVDQSPASGNGRTLTKGNSVDIYVSDPSNL